MMLHPDTVVLVFAKAPVEGEVNTRLIPDIGVRAATKLQHDLLHHRLSMLAKAELCDVTLMCSPDTKHECFISCVEKYPIALVTQRGVDLGERISSAITHALIRYKCCIVIGTDAPALDEKAISQAIDKLHEGNEVVFAPAEDGGYVLVGMQRCHDYLFQNISWGTADVMQQSRDALEQRDVAYIELATCWDVDRLEDYQRYLAMKKLSQC